MNSWHLVPRKINLKRYRVSRNNLIDLKKFNRKIIKTVIKRILCKILICHNIEINQTLMMPLVAYPTVLTTMAKSCINKTLFQIIITNLTLLRKMKDFSKNYYKNSKNGRNWQLCWWNKKHRWTNQHSLAHTPKETCKRALWKVVFHQIKA